MAHSQKYSWPNKMAAKHRDMKTFYDPAYFRDTARCLVPSCRKFRRDHADLKFFGIPSSLKAQWCQALVNNIPKRTLYVCENHINIDRDCYITRGGNLKLKPTANLVLTRTWKENAVPVTNEPNVSQTLHRPEETTEHQDQSSPIIVNIPAGSDTLITMVDDTSKAKTSQALCDPLQEFGNESEEPEIKEESTHDADSSNCGETEEIRNTERVFIKSVIYNDESEDHSQTKRARFETSIVTHDYAEQMYEFGKYVAEQLLCLDVEEAQVVQIEIRDLLLKHCQNAGVTDSSMQSATNSRCYTVVHKTINPVASSLKSDPKVSTARSLSKIYCSRPPKILSNSRVKDLNRNSSPTVHQSVLKVNTVRPQVTQSVLKVNSIRPQVTPSVLKVNNIRPQVTQSVLKVNSIRPQVTPSVLKVNSIRPQVTQSVLNVNTVRPQVIQESFKVSGQDLSLDRYVYHRPSS